MLFFFGGGIQGPDQEDIEEEDEDDISSDEFQSHDDLADFEVNHDELIYGECAGSGSFGTVYKGNWHGPVAIKKLNFGEPSEVQLEDFRNEVAVLMYVCLLCRKWFFYCILVSFGAWLPYCCNVKG